MPVARKVPGCRRCRSIHLLPDPVIALRPPALGPATAPAESSRVTLGPEILEDPADATQPKPNLLANDRGANRL